MAIIPEDITTIRVDQLANLGVTLESLFPHTVGTQLTSSPISDLVTLVANAIETTEALGFLPISVTDGQQLPDIPTTPGFFLAGAGTYLNVNGFPDLVCTENLNVIMTVDDHWEIAVEIAVNPLTGSVQSVTGSAVDNTDPLNPVINLSSAVTSVNGLTGAVVLDGDNIDVTDPTTSTDGTLNDALANIYASGGTPDLQAVVTQGGEVISTDGLKKVEIDKDNGQIKISTRPTTGDAWVQNALYSTNAEFEQGNGVVLSSLFKITGSDDGGMSLENLGAETKTNVYPSEKNSFWQHTSETEGGFYKYSAQRVIKVSSFTALEGYDYVTNGTIAITDPITYPNSGYSVYVLGGTTTIDSVSYGIGTLIYRYYDGTTWDTIVLATTDDIPTLDTTPTDGSTNGVESNGVFDALNTKVTFWGSALDGTSVANTLTITATYSQLIPANTFVAGDNIFLNFRATSPGAKTSASSIYFYVNTADNLSGATQLGIYTGSATNRTLQADRILSVKGSTTKTINPTASISTDTGATSSMTSHTINWAVDQYIIFAIGHTVNDQTMFGDFYSIEKK